MRIEDIDKNFRTAEVGGINFDFSDALKPPFALSGFAWHDGGSRLSRLPEAILPQTNPGVRELTWHTSGGMVRFKTDSPSIAIRAELYCPCDMSHMPRNGSSGFDLYLGTGTGKKYFKSAMPGSGVISWDTLLASGLKAGVMREWTLYMPLYSGVEKLAIGLAPGAEIAPPTPFAYEKPVLFYGSSITQGGCASRTGNAYSHLLTRRLDANMINLGFSGNGKGEPAIAEAIAELELSAFVMDYDYNAPDVVHLRNTHEPFFRIIRNRHPELPIIMLSRCDFRTDDESGARREVIRGNYEKFRGEGDRHVYFIDGETLFAGPEADACTVDGCHPNDLGFYRMAEKIYPTLAAALQNR